MTDDTFDFLGNTDISDKQLYQKIWGDKHTSPWFFLRIAIRSSLASAVQAASLWIKHYHQAKKKCKSPAELAFISGLAYSEKLTGPLLSIIVLSAASVEAFARHCFVSTLRRKGYQQQDIKNKFYEFDNTVPVQRVKLIVSELTADILPSQIETEINELFGFRNEVMHGDPLYDTLRVKLKSDRKEKKTIEKKPSSFKYYPDLTTNNRPLSLSHCLLSTVTHDKLVEHIIGTAQSQAVLEFLNEIDMTNIDKGLIWGDPTCPVNYEKSSVIAKEMNLINRALNKVSLKEHMEFIRCLRRQ
jgi:hypothetical protein